VEEDMGVSPATLRQRKETAALWTGDRGLSSVSAGRGSLWKEYKMIKKGSLHKKYPRQSVGEAQGIPRMGHSLLSGELA